MVMVLWFSRSLRSNATVHENRLWYEFLRSYPVRFNRQRVIGKYIVDFYCRKANLVVELNGSQHYDEAAMLYDKERTQYRNQLGIQVLRFTNFEIMDSLQEVCAVIDDAVTRRV